MGEEKKMRLDSPRQPALTLACDRYRAKENRVLRITKEEGRKRCSRKEAVVEAPSCGHTYVARRRKVGARVPSLSPRERTARSAPRENRERKL